MAKRTKGKCKYCGKEYTFSYMNKHLPVCEERQKKWAEETGGKKTGYFELAIYPKYNREHWLYVEIKETALLKDLDQFLRDIWLECCGHLSAFDINGVRYDVMPQDDFFWGEPAKSMNYKLKSVLEKGMTFGYEYDFGSTTELMITVVNYWIRSNRKEKLIILSRNNPVETLCEECGKKSAVYICTQCYYEGGGWLCEDCAETHECGEEMLLPICNSPRMGVCGYCGSDIYPEQFVPDI
ncbi:MAG: plasmid pRiA4b ORF-3 family protein [Lachnospiraceae bacterium]|jgi:hypothetical protein|nr:plasmid pRiA4b ORF-3 family protein [Lachnospiraceae bacterium]MCI9679797.1 plasmid pRiA4b ORF-3 family protein [Lachnospiraceae bacterium]